MNIAKMWLGMMRRRFHRHIVAELAFNNRNSKWLFIYIKTKENKRKEKRGKEKREDRLLVWIDRVKCCRNWIWNLIIMRVVYGMNNESQKPFAGRCSIHVYRRNLIWVLYQDVIRYSRQLAHRSTEIDVKENSLFKEASSNYVWSNDFGKEAGKEVKGLNS